MELLDLITSKAATADKTFLVIGGHAVNSYGEGRQTGDVDLMVSETDRDFWEEMLQGLRYTIFNKQAAFTQFSAPQVGTWPIDIMFVNENTFASMEKESKEVSFGGAHQVKVPSPHHLISLKLHAAKQPDRGEILKDLSDILAIVRAAGIDLHSPSFKEMCLKYGNESVYSDLCRFHGGKDE